MMFWNQPRLASPAQDRFRRQTDVRIYAAIVGQWPPREEFLHVADEPAYTLEDDWHPPTIMIASWVKRVGELARVRFVEAKVRVSAPRKVA